jgi:hypothetical protein
MAWCYRYECYPEETDCDFECVLCEYLQKDCDCDECSSFRYFPNINKEVKE